MKFNRNVRIQVSPLSISICPSPNDFKIRHKGVMLMKHANVYYENFQTTMQRKKPLTLSN